MALQITSTTPDELTLTPATVGQGCIRWLIGGFGALGLLVGGGLLATRYPAGADVADLLAAVFAVMGTGFVLLSFFVGGRRLWAWPRWCSTGAWGPCGCAARPARRRRRTSGTPT